MTNAPFKNLTSIRQNSRKGSTRTAAQSRAQKNGLFHATDAPLIQPSCPTVQLCPLLMAQLSPLLSLPALTPESLHPSLTGAISLKTETIRPLEVKHMCGWAVSFIGGVEGLNHTHLWITVL